MESEFKIQCVSDFLINHLRSFFTFQTRITERERVGLRELVLFLSIKLRTGQIQMKKITEKSCNIA